MPNDRAAQFTAEALAKVDAFISAHPDYSRHGVQQPGQGSTNRVVFARHGAATVVFKVFCEPERKERECFGLRHWAETRLVPELIWDADPLLLVMSHIPGHYLHQARALEGDAAWRAACRATGQAVGSLVALPLSAAERAAFEARYYGEQATLEAYLGRILELGWGIQAQDPDFQDLFWQENLAFIEAQLEPIHSQPRALYHQDVSNLHVARGHFCGFFDLEMCRVGCAALQLASALGMFAGDEAGWPLFCDGWVAAGSEPLDARARSAVAAARYLLGWREISRYLSYDGTPGTGYAWASPADPAHYHQAFEATAQLLDT